MRDIRSNLQYDDIERDYQNVLDTLQAKELEVPLTDGKWYLMRIIPYRTAENMIEGVLLTFTETTVLRAAADYAKSIVETVRESLVILDGGFRIISANLAFHKMFHLLKDETQGQLLFELSNRQWDIPKLRRLLGEILPHNEKFEDFEVEHDFPGIGRKRMLLNGRKIIQKEINAQPMILLAIEDATSKK